MENWNKLGKYLKKELPEDEIEEVLKAEEFELGQMEEIWTEAGKMYQYENPDHQLAWDNISAKTGGEEKQKNFHLSPLYKMAASIVVVIGLGILLFVSDFMGGQKELKTIASTDTPKKVELSDGSEVWLNDHSSVSFPEKFTRKERTVTLKGEAFFKVARNEKVPFVVYASNTRTEVLGTSFNIRAYDLTDVLVSVNTGKVKIGIIDYPDENMVLTKGESGNINLAKNLVSKSMASPHNSVAWLTGELNFQNTPLKEVVNSLATYYNSTIVIKDTILNVITFTGNFKNQELETILQAIDFSLNTVHVKQDEVTIIKNQ